MKLEVAALILTATTAGVFTFAHTNKTRPPELRDAVADDLNDVKLSDIKSQSKVRIPTPEPVVVPERTSSVNAKPLEYANVMVSKEISVKIGDAIIAALTAAKKRMSDLNPDISIKFEHNHFIENNPQVVFSAPIYRRVFFLHEAKEVRYEMAAPLQKAALFWGKKAHPDTMNIQEQVDAVIDCAEFVTKKISAEKEK